MTWVRLIATVNTCSRSGSGDRSSMGGRARTRIGRGQVCHEQVNVGLSNETVTPVGVTVRWAISRTVTKVPPVPFTRTCEVVVVTKLRLLLLSLKANVSCPS